jgi:hypothetical protein
VKKHLAHRANTVSRTPSEFARWNRLRKIGKLLLHHMQILKSLRLQVVTRNRFVPVRVGGKREDHAQSCETVTFHRVLLRLRDLDGSLQKTTLCF